jgi:hypothetical protein
MATSRESARSQVIGRLAEWLNDLSTCLPSLAEGAEAGDSEESVLGEDETDQGGDEAEPEVASQVGRCTPNPGGSLGSMAGDEHGEGNPRCSASQRCARAGGRIMATARRTSEGWP